jgi:hypothetical protein
MFVAAIIGAGTLSALLFVFVLPLAGIGAGAAGIVALSLMGKFYFLKDSSASEEIPPPQPPEPAPSEAIEVPRSSGDVTPKNSQPLDAEDDTVLDTGNFQPAKGGDPIPWKSANSRQPAAEPAILNVTDITSEQAVESVENFREKCDVPIDREFIERVSASSRDCRRLDLEQTKELAKEEFQANESANSREERKIAAGLSEDFFEGASSGNYDGCVEKLGRFIILGDALRGEFWCIQNYYLGIGDSAVTFSRESAVKKLIEVIYNSYDNNPMRLRALMNFLGGPYWQGVSYMLMSAIHSVDPRQKFLRHFAASGAQYRFSSVRFNADTTVAIKSYFGGSGPFQEIMFEEAEASGGPISQDSFTFMAIQYRIGTPFDKGNPSALPDGWAEATREKAIPPIIAVDVEYADCITR